MLSWEPFISNESYKFEVIVRETVSEVSGVDQSGDHSPCASSQPGVGFAEPGADNEEDGDVDDHDHEEWNGEEDDVDDESEDWGWRH